MVVWVVEFSREGNIFGQKSISSKKIIVFYKLKKCGILENQVSKKLKLSKNAF
jgi:hypothetical protein